MANTRIISQQLALFASASPSTGNNQTSGNMVQLFRAQEVNLDWTITRNDVGQIGALSPLSKEITDSPTVNMSTSWLIPGVYNESGIGFVVNGQSGALSFILNNSARDKNYYIEIVPEGNDANTYTSTTAGVISIGNAAVASYATSAAVGGFPTANLSVQGLNATYNVTNSGADSPAINPINGAAVTGITFQLPNPSSGLAGMNTTLRPGDISLTVTPEIGLALNNDVCLQSYNISFDLNLQPKTCLGSRFAIARNPQFPVDVTTTLEVAVKDIGTGNISQILCSDTPKTIVISLRNPSCGTGIGTEKIKYTLLGAKQTSQAFKGGVGQGDATATVTYVSQIGGPADTVNNFLISGSW